MGFRLLPKGVEEAAFKPVPEGWLFTTASPALVMPRRTYIVTEAAKPAIAARVRLSRYANLIAALVEVPMLMAAAVEYPWLLSPTPRAFLAWGVLVGLICLVAAVIDHLIMRAAIRDLPRTEQKITTVDMWKRQSQSMSVSALAFFTMVGALCAAVNLYTFVHEGKILVGFGGAFMAVLGVFFGTMLVAKLRARRSAEQALREAGHRGTGR